MSLGKTGSRLRCLAVWTAASVGMGVTALVTCARTRALVDLVAEGRLSRAPLDVALTDLAATLLLGCAAWLWLVTSAVVLEAARGGRAGAGPGVPTGVRRVVLAACGVALVGGLAQPSYAHASTAGSSTAGSSTAGRSTDRPRIHVTHRGLSGLPLPDRAETSRHPRRPPRETVVVGAGDTLWAIAVREVPPDSPDSLVAARWHAIYAANRSLIGPDPDVILPGQRLVLPRRETS